MDDITHESFTEPFKLTREQAAELYAKFIRQEMAKGGLDAESVNNAIIARWSRSGLRYIKGLAWNIVERKKK